MISGILLHEAVYFSIVVIGKEKNIQQMVDVLQIMGTLSREALDRFSLAIFFVLEVDVEN